MSVMWALWCFAIGMPLSRARPPADCMSSASFFFALCLLRCVFKGMCKRDAKHAEGDSACRQCKHQSEGSIGALEFLQSFMTHAISKGVVDVVRAVVCLECGGGLSGVCRREEW